MNRYATPKSEEERRTLSEHGYRTLNGEESLECIRGLEGLIVDDLDIKKVPTLFLRGIIELRYYRKGAKDIENLKEKGNSIFICFKDGGGKELFPIRLRSEKEVKELPSISELEEGK
jgi:hypothetical protein